MKYKLLIVDDHLIFLESMSLLIESLPEFELVGTAISPRGWCPHQLHVRKQY